MCIITSINADELKILCYRLLWLEYSVTDGKALSSVSWVFSRSLSQHNLDKTVILFYLNSGDYNGTEKSSYVTETN